MEIINLYKITERLATHGLGPMNEIMGLYGKMVKTVHFPGINELEDTGFYIIDVRLLDDDGDSNTLDDYEWYIQESVDALDEGKNIVICCESGQSRSNAVAIGVLIKYFGMDFYNAFNLVDWKVPIMNIDPTHIQVLKKIFKVGLP